MWPHQKDVNEMFPLSMENASYPTMSKTMFLARPYNHSKCDEGVFLLRSGNHITMMVTRKFRGQLYSPCINNSK